MMHVLKFILISLFFMPAAISQSGSSIQLDSEIEKVTLFQQGAQITRTATVQLPEGTHNLVFTHLTQHMDPKSIQLAGTGKFTILSISHQQNFLTEEDKSESMLKLEREIDEVERKIARLQARLDALSREKEMILANKSLANETSGYSLEQLKQTAEFFRNRIEAIYIEVDQLQRELIVAQRKKQQLENQLDHERKAFTKKTGQVSVKLNTAAPTTANFELTYLVNNASWQSTYDARVLNLESPVELIQKARIVQQTGEDWRDVDLTLSTGNPQRSGQVPYLSTWYIDFASPRYVDGLRIQEEAQKSQRLRNVDDMAEAASTSAQEMDYLNFNVQENISHQEYTIEMPQTIPSSANPEVVQLRKLDLPAKFQYHIKPKLDKDAFLIARIYDWDTYNLMEGELSLYNGQTYVGEAYLNVQSPDDTLQLSLGRDENILVQRHQVKSKEEKSLLGGKRIEHFRWKIEVRNSKSSPVDILLKEPVPVSKNSEIEVEIEDLSGGKLNAETGIVSWKFNLAPAEEKEFHIAYNVEYPKDRNLRY